jgi:hypothetical protein
METMRVVLGVVLGICTLPQFRQHRRRTQGLGEPVICASQLSGASGERPDGQI